MINFNKSTAFSESIRYVFSLLSSHSISSNGKFTKECEKNLEDNFGYKKVLLTSSCTAALEICAMITKKYCGEKNEIIMPSYTFVSSANSFAKFGFKIKFIDVKSDMNVDEKLVLNAISNRTAAVVTVNYGGFSSNLELLAKICKEREVFFIEDNAQGIDAKFKDQYLGTFGDFSTFSFHETKNVTSGGEGGAFCCNNLNYIEDAKIIREKGTNREQFFCGIVDKYTWVGFGGHYLMSELQSAFLLGQLENLDKVTQRRREIWQMYHHGLQFLETQGVIELQKESKDNVHNGHIFYLKCRDLNERSALITKLKQDGFGAVFHYIPLHESPAGQICGEFVGQNVYTSRDSLRLLRLPIWFDLKDEDINRCIKSVVEFYEN